MRIVAFHTAVGTNVELQLKKWVCQTVKPEKRFPTGWSGIGFPAILTPCPLTGADKTWPVLESLERKIATLLPCILPPWSLHSRSQPPPSSSPPRPGFPTAQEFHCVPRVPQSAINHVIPALPRFWKVVVLSCYLELGMLVGNNNLGWVFAAGRWNGGWRITSCLPIC